MNNTLILLLNLCYLISAAFFIIGLKMLSSPETAKRGNLLSACGMFLAIIATIYNESIIHYKFILLGLLLGAIVGIISSQFVKMTEMPQMIALLNGFGGLSSLLVGWSIHNLQQTSDILSLFTIVLSVFIGGLTFTGSLIAFGKLHEILDGKPFLFANQQIINLSILSLILIVCFLYAMKFSNSTLLFLLLLILSFAFGVLTVIPIGGADMPVVISLLNSYSGLAAAAAGFVIKNNLLIISGSLVGASGIILTSIMCKAMNRSLSNVLFSGFGATQNTSKKTEQLIAKSMLPKDVSFVLEAAKSLVIVPGYGLAVAQAQHVLKELSVILENNSTDVKYAIHPVAGRMPGHMNVLLAEADIPYDSLLDMDDVNRIIDSVDVCIVIGANDVVNTSARIDKTSPIFGMPIIDVDKAKVVYVLKRSMASGFAGIDNPLFYNENTYMIFGDAKQTLQQLVQELKG